DVDEFFSLPHIVKPGETISSTAFTRKPGGKGANQAFAVAKAGGSVDLEGSIGDDGTWIRDLLRQGGVGVDRLQVVQGEVTGRAIIQSASDGENILHKGANFYISPNDAQPDLSPYTHLLLQNEIPLPTTLAYLQANPSITSIFNPSPMLSPDELRAFPWAHLSWLIVNEGELETLLAALDPDTPVSQTADVVDTAKANIGRIKSAKGFHRDVSIICTLGAKGIIWSTAGQEEVGQLPAAKADVVRDTTGAGDCFAGYFAAGMMRNKGEEGLNQVLKTCLTACAMCVEKPGAMESYPPLKETLSRKQA
ncbi:putative ATP binding protein, partial [Papiliotrema laurentii]